MYCSQCGKEIETDMKYCPYCGAIVNINVNENVNQSEQDAPSLLFAFISFFAPIIGIVLYIIWRKDSPKKAASCLKGLAAGIIFEIILYIIFLSMISNSVNTYDEIYFNGRVIESVLNKINVFLS